MVLARLLLVKVLNMLLVTQGLQCSRIVMGTIPLLPFVMVAMALLTALLVFPRLVMVSMSFLTVLLFSLWL